MLLAMSEQKHIPIIILFADWKPKRNGNIPMQTKVTPNPEAIFGMLSSLMRDLPKALVQELISDLPKALINELIFNYVAGELAKEISEKAD